MADRDGAPSARTTRRALVLGGAALAGNAALAARLWHLQVVESATYRDQAVRNRLRTEPVRPVRGLIFDRNLEPLVQNVPVFSVWIRPADLPPEREGPVAAALAALTGELAEDLRFKISLARENPIQPARVAAAIPRKSALAIEERRIELPGVVVRVTTRRFYTQGGSFGHLLGFTGSIPAESVKHYRAQGVSFDEDVGLAGIEGWAQVELRGSDGTRRVAVDALGRELHELSAVPPRTGWNVVLTVSVRDQEALREVLARHLALRDEGAGVIVVVRAETGDVVAMASLPDYDNNLFASSIDTADYEALARDPRRPLINHAIAGLYPPGSTYKMVAAATALESGRIQPSTIIECDGRLALPSGWAFDDWLKTGHGLVDLKRSIAESCNIYFYNISGGNPYTNRIGVGNARLAEFERQFGFGARTGIELPGEATGLVPTAEWKQANLGQPWVTGDTYHAAIGQGLVQVTPLQLAMMYASIGNGGRVLTPRLVDRILDARGAVVQRTPERERGRLPLSPTNLELLRGGLLEAVHGRNGTGARARSEHAVLAGKTGTAEYSGPRDRDGKLPSHAWFAGYAPHPKPEFAFAVLVRDGGEGSFSAAPIARDIVDYLMTGDLPPLPQERPDFVPPQRRLKP